MPAIPQFICTNLSLLQMNYGIADQTLVIHLHGVQRVEVQILSPRFFSLKDLLKQP